MGWFSKKKGLNTPSSLDAPPPISSEDKQGFGLSEPDIPPIPSMSDMKQKEFRMKEFKMGSDDEVPLPPPELKEEKNADAFPEFPSFPEMPKEFPEKIKQEKKYDEMQFVQEEETPPEIVSRLPFEHYSKEDFPSEDEIKEILKPNIPNFDRLLKQDTKQKQPKISSFITLTQYKMIMLLVMQMNGLVETQIDTVIRLNNIQEEKSGRYNKFQSDLEGVYNQFTKLDELIFGKNEVG